MLERGKSKKSAYIVKSFSTLANIEGLLSHTHTTVSYFHSASLSCCIAQFFARRLMMTLASLSKILKPSNKIAKGHEQE